MKNLHGHFVTPDQLPSAKQTREILPTGLLNFQRVQDLTVAQINACGVKFKNFSLQVQQ